MKRLLKRAAIGIGIAVALVVVLVLVIAVVATSGGDDQPTVKREEPAPTAKPVATTVSAETQQIVLETIGASPGVLDAAISQDGEYISLVLVVGAATSEQYAKQLGENFIRQFKTMSQDDPPGELGRDRDVQLHGESSRFPWAEGHSARREGIVLGPD